MKRADALRRGNVSILAAALIVPMVGAAGIAIDATRLWMVQSRLQAALDAAVLVAAREGSAATADSDALAMFWTNFGRTSALTETGYLGAVATVPAISSPDSTSVQMTATATLSTPILGVLGFTQSVVRASATATKGGIGLELALVLDITGSMATNNNIGTLRTAATNLVDTLYGSSDTLPNLWVSVVPYVASVNIGTTHADWLAAGSLDQTLYSTAGWQGCVQARYQNGNDSNDATPAQAPFTPYLWASTKGLYKTSKGTVVTGDNDWYAGHITALASMPSAGNNAVSPNLGCSATPILPLTASRTVILNTIAGLQATYRGGTMSNLGLQAGWFTLSPNWRGLWGDPTLPLDYNTRNMRKVVVIMTDGTNQWYDWPGGAPGQAPSSFVGQVADADYTAYGRLAQNWLGITIPHTSNVQNDISTAIANAKTEIDSRMSQLCTSMKAVGIQIYTITFTTGAQSLWQNCASSPADYFVTRTQSDLLDAFSNIATQLSNLRLSH
jgi:Flp pilus assembly protein TadG